MVQETKTRAPHNIIMESRKKLAVTGVCDIDSFNEECIVAITSMGVMTVKGEGLRIDKLSVDSGDLNIDGCIDSITYSDAKNKKSGSFIKNLFK